MNDAVLGCGDNTVNSSCVPDVCGGRGLDERVLFPEPRTYVKNSVTAADLNHISMPSSFRTSWQSLTLQASSVLTRSGSFPFAFFGANMRRVGHHAQRRNVFIWREAMSLIARISSPVEQFISLPLDIDMST
jgi:hypothetical protein